MRVVGTAGILVNLVHQAAAIGRPAERAQGGAGIGHWKAFDLAAVDGHQEQPVSGSVAAEEQELAAVRRAPVRLDVLVGKGELPDAAAGRVDQEHRLAVLGCRAQTASR